MHAHVTAFCFAGDFQTLYLFHLLLQSGLKELEVSQRWLSLESVNGAVNT